MVPLFGRLFNGDRAVAGGCHHPIAISDRDHNIHNVCGVSVSSYSCTLMLLYAWERTMVGSFTEVEVHSDG